MKKLYDKLTIKDLHRFFPINRGDNMSEDFYVSRLKFDESMKVLSPPCRFDCYMAYYCIRGEFQIEINLRKFEMQEGSLLIYIPGNIIRLSSTLGSREAEIILVAASKSLISSVRFDPSHQYEESMLVLTNPYMSLNEEEIIICRKYYVLAEDLMASGHLYLKDTILSLGTSIFHYLGNLWTKRIDESEELPNNTLRANIICENFMKLVHKYHCREREVGFYANKLCLTPKYLSQLISRTSGKSAPDWINSFVILEAKNLLKYTDKDIKEIAYELNFRSTPVFYRFFKKQTGMTPAEYRKS